MNILFFCREKATGEISPVIESQANSLEDQANISILPIKGNKGWGYILAARTLRKYLNQNKPHLIHAHYSISAFVAALAFTRVPVVCSLMGSDLWDRTITRPFIPLFHKYLWSKTIVKSEAMRRRLPGSVVIPNGVDMQNFRPINRHLALEKTGFSKDHKNIIFVSTEPSMPVKNLDLARTAITKLNEKYYPEARLHVLEDISFQDLPYYYSAADLLLLTSKNEGSPNVVKEALACNCKVVSTDVGDVKSMIDDIDGCNICPFEPEEVVEKIRDSIEYKDEINARDHISHIDSQRISKKIIELYKDVIQKPGS